MILDPRLSQWLIRPLSRHAEELLAYPRLIDYVLAFSYVLYVLYVLYVQYLQSVRRW